MYLESKNWLAIFFAFLIAAGTIFSPIEANSGSSDKNTDNPCENLWLDYVSSVEGVIPSSFQEDKAIIFASQKGKIFNCLDQNLQDSIIQELQFWEMARSRSIASSPKNEDNPPSNFCNTSYGSTQGMQVMIIHMPTDFDAFASQACNVRLRGVLNRIVKFLQKE